jgi:hypothetical protein
MIINILKEIDSNKTLIDISKIIECNKKERSLIDLSELKSYEKNK